MQAQLVYRRAFSFIAPPRELTGQARTYANNFFNIHRLQDERQVCQYVRRGGEENPSERSRGCGRSLCMFAGLYWYAHAVARWALE